MAQDPIGDIPNIRLDKDDLDTFHRTRAQSTKNGSNNSPQPDDTQSSSNSPSWFSFLFLLLLIIGGASYWSFEQYKVMQHAQSRIAELENRLSATGEDMDQSAAALQVKVSELSKKTAELWEQMDKLWASAWRRNQTEISALNKTVASLESTSAKSGKKLTTSIADNQTTIALLQEQIENQSSLIKQLNQQFDAVNKTDTNVEQQLASLREKLISTALANNNLINRIDDLADKVTTIEKKVNQPKAVTVPTTP